MARRENPEEEPESPDEAAERAEIAKRVLANPFEYITRREIRILFRFGERTMRALSALDPPSVNNRLNPLELKGWISQNQRRITEEGI